MNSSTFELAILLSLRDVASGRLDRFEDKLRATGKEGRNFLEQHERLRKSMGRDLTIGGVGIATMGALKNGVGVAGDFEDAITDLRTSLTQLNADGSVDVARLNEQMHRLDQIGKRLGNNLPGNTQDFLELFATLKEKGVDATEIIDGAGEAVANLAVVSKQIPKELAVPFAEFGQQFQLKGADYVKLADLFARARAATGTTPNELVEASKYFQLRAGASLGMTGFQSATSTTQLLSLLGRKGLKGSEAGTGLSAVFSRLVVTTPEQKKTLDELRKKSKIDLQFFDKKGQFLGIENAISQLEKLNKLSTETRTRVVKKLFEQEGMGAANILIDAGIGGYRASNQELERKLSLQQQVNEKTATFNQKMEALSGTLDNVKVTVFEPLLPPLTTAANKANELVGNLQGFAAAHPGLTQTAVYTLAIGGAALTAYSGVKVLITGWKLWRLASMVGGAEKGLLSFLAQTRTEAATTAAAVQTSAVKVAAAKAVMAQPSQMQLPWAENMRGKGPVQQELLFMTAASDNLGKSLDATAKKATGLRGKLSAWPRFVDTTVHFGETGLSKVKGMSAAIPPELKIGVLFLAAQWSINNVLDMIDLMFEYSKSKSAEGGAHGGNLQTIQKAREEFTRMGQPVPREIWQGQARASLLSINRENQLKEALGGWSMGSWAHDLVGRRMFGADINPYADFRRFTPGGGTPRVFRERAPELANAEVMAEFRKIIDSWKLPTESRAKVDDALKAAFPESFSAATKMAAADMERLSGAVSQSLDIWQRFNGPLQQLVEGMGSVNTQAAPLSDTLRNTQSSASRVPPAFDRAAGAAQSFADRVNSLDVRAPTPLTLPPFFQTQSAPSPSRGVEQSQASYSRVATPSASPR
ncbi:MAG: phage tail tape measure protein, partial [Pyrinomonadaceae bacterium]